MNNELKTIFGDAITVDGTLVPAASIKYKGDSSVYFIWTVTGTKPGLNGDDDQLCGICTVDIDVYSKSNFLNLIAEIKKIMKNNEWIWTEDGPDMFEEDTGYYHKTMSFEKERAL